MGIQANNSFANTFGSRSLTGAAAAPAETRPAAKYWANIGYTADTTDEDGNPTTVFVSLKQGIALDTVEAFDVSRIRNAKMASLRGAQNDLHADMMEVAETLEPGQSKLILVQVEIRRVNEAVEAPASSENPLSRKLEVA